MDEAEGWNYDEYSLFLEGESFNVFGDYDFNFDFNSTLDPGFHEVNNSFDLGEWDEPSEAVNSAPQDINLQLPTLEVRVQPSLTTTADYSSTSHCSELSSGSALSPDCEHQDSAHGPSVSITRSECRSKTPATKRKYLTAFLATSGQDVRLHTRRQFSEEQKKVVALNRTIGVCLHCRLRKVACDDGIPCNRCIKRAGSIFSGQEICMRRGLVATRFDHIDLLRITNLESRLDGLALPNNHPLHSWGYIWFPNSLGNDGIYKSEAYIKVPIIELKPHNFPPQRVILWANYFSRSHCNMPDTNQAIPSDSVPSIETLLRAYLSSTRTHSPVPNPFSRLSKAFRDFAESYCNRSSALPLQGLLEKIVKLQLLFTLYRVLPSMKSAPDGDDGDIVSTTIWLQIRLPIGKEIISKEREVLAEIDRMIRCKSGIGRHNPLATWAALWLLVLSYKEYMIFCKAWPYGPEGDKIYSLNEHLYNMLTSIYAALYKATSPLTLDWRSEEVASMLGNDTQLINLFCNIKTEIFWFQTLKDSLHPEDSLFRHLVLENENKLVRAHIETAKRQGIL